MIGSKKIPSKNSGGSNTLKKRNVQLWPMTSPKLIFTSFTIDHSLFFKINLYPDGLQAFNALQVFQVQPFNAAL